MKIEGTSFAVMACFSQRLMPAVGADTGAIHIGNARFSVGLLDFRFCPPILTVIVEAWLLPKAQTEVAL